MRFRLLTALFWSICPLAVFSQEYGYIHYGSRDGLAGSTVYSMVQDKDGFLWMGTEVGLSRFDGTHFKNFTKEDGLPDNEIIQLFADSKGRIWMAPFRKAICYYYKGKIHTQDNDIVLKQIHINDHVVRFAEDKGGNILMLEYSKLHLVEVNGQVAEIDTINARPVSMIKAISARADDGFRVIEGDSLFDFRNNRFQQRKIIHAQSYNSTFFGFTANLLLWRPSISIATAIFFNHDSTYTIPFATRNHLNFSIIDSNYVGVCTLRGVIIYNILKPDNPEHFLPDVPVSNVLKDSEGNMWFTTLGHGLYKLSSPFVSNVRIRKNNLQAQVFSFARYKESILASTEIDVISRFNRKTGKQEKGNIIVKELSIVPVNFLQIYNKKNIICGTNSFLYKLGPDFKKQAVIKPMVVKGLFLYGDKLFVATKNMVLTINPETFKIIDTIWHERATTVFVSNDSVYIGTLGGLYCLFPDKSKQFLGENNPALKARITSLQKDAAGILWASTYGDGIIGYKNNRIVRTINRRNGLTSDICRALYLCGNTLWVGTDKGINKINITRPDYPITKYTTGDGLASDIINALYVDSNKVFVGTPEGFTFFDEEKLTTQSRCDLLFTDIAVGSETWSSDSMPGVIPHAKNNVRFDFVGISYKSGGDIRYRYRLLGLDSAWKETRETFLSYPILPSGDYQLQLQAINKFDVHSQVLTAGFTIEKLLYEKSWFRVLIGLLFLAVTGATVLLFIRRIRKREREKTAISKRIGELEQLSRKAQMNPHFIFNSLNSIQQYVMDADVAGANKFISGFSRLIRQTLDFSSKPEISLDEELDYLTNYLEIEKTRLENAFSYSVLVEDGVNPADYYIPPMILQPFVENSVRHGLRFRRDKAGMVTITVNRDGDYLVCIIEDNGIGRKAAMKYKSISPINYQSKGLSLTADRISMFNQEHLRKITMYIHDLEDDIHNSLGTRVTISFPVF